MSMLGDVALVVNDLKTQAHAAEEALSQRLITLRKSMVETQSLSVGLDEEVNFLENLETMIRSVAMRSRVL